MGLRVTGRGDLKARFLESLPPPLPSTQPGSEAPTTIERKGGDTVDVWHMEEAQ